VLQVLHLGLLRLRQQLLLQQVLLPQLGRKRQDHSSLRRCALHHSSGHPPLLQLLQVVQDLLLLQPQWMG
jgi:hypothetical protein